MHDPPACAPLLQETWLRIQARHVRIDHYRRATRTTAREEKLTDESRFGEAASAEQTPLEDLEALLAPLSASQREVLHMLKVSGMSLEEVARATSSTVVPASAFAGAVIGWVARRCLPGGPVPRA